MNMAHGQTNDGLRMAVGKAVKEHLALPADGNQPGLTQRLELIGYSTGRHADGFSQMAGTELARIERQKDFKPGLGGDEAEKIGKRGDF